MPAQTFSVDDIWQPSDGLPGKDVLVAIADRLGQVWQIPDLTRRVRIAYNPRLRTALGRAELDDRRVELNTRLLLANPDELLDTLAHELAHIVARVRYGQVAPHGEHFRTLMRAVNLSHEATHSLKVRHRKRRRYLYLHRCGDCGYSFVARSVRRNYYCLACGPEMRWEIWRAPNTADGRRRLDKMAGLAAS